MLELFVTISTDAKFEVALPPAENDDFHDKFTENCDAFDEMLTRVDVRKSEATEEQLRIDQ